MTNDPFLSYLDSEEAELMVARALVREMHQEVAGEIQERWGDVQDGCGGWTWDPPCGACRDCVHAQMTNVGFGEFRQTARELLSVSRTALEEGAAEHRRRLLGRSRRKALIVGSATGAVVGLLLRMVAPGMAFWSLLPMILLSCFVLGVVWSLTAKTAQGYGSAKE